MILRLPLAFVVGLSIYMIAMMMTTYDGVLSMIFQPIVGSLFTLLALGAVAAIGSPLLIKSIWVRWQEHWWISLFLLAAGFVALLASWHPALREQVWNPDLKVMVESFHPVLLLSGWLAVMFAIAYCPRLGLHGEGRWL